VSADALAALIEASCAVVVAVVSIVSQFQHRRKDH
jgi:hypothetical protein